MRSDPLSTDQVFDGVDGVSFVHNLEWASMSGKELITSTDGRCTELIEYSVMDGSYSITAWKYVLVVPLLKRRSVLRSIHPYGPTVQFVVTD